METLEQLQKQFEYFVSQYNEITTELYAEWDLPEQERNQDKQIDLRYRADDFRKKYEQILSDIFKIDNDYCINMLENYHKNKKFDCLLALIENFRADYSFYWHCRQDFLKKILQMSIELMNSSDITTHEAPMHFVKQTYDIIFHQYSIMGSKTENTNLYFQLSCLVLDAKELRDNDITYDSQEGSVYFISMMCNSLEDRREEFLVLWDKIQWYRENIYGEAAYNMGWWRDSYERLTSPHKTLPTEEA